MNCNIHPGVDLKMMSFIERDITTAINALGDEIPSDVSIIYINNYDGINQHNKEAMLTEAVKTLKQLDNTIIITTAYVSENEYPSDKYYIDERDYATGKRQVPVDDIMTRESNMLERLGFKYINHHVQYKYSRAYVYGNELGLLLKEYFDKIGLYGAEYITKGLPVENV